MAINKIKKGEILEKVQGAVASSASVVFVNFHGLSVEDTTTLRRSLRNENVAYTVAKKTLIGKALDDAKIEGEKPPLEGELAIAYGEDLLAPAREVLAFQKDHKDNIAILGGIFDGAYMNQSEMMEIALIPPKPVLYGQFVNLINSPIQRFAVVLDQIAQKQEA